MIVGVDIGASATKIAGLQGDNILFTHYEGSRTGSTENILTRLLLDQGTPYSEIDVLALTGVGAENDTVKQMGFPVTIVPEIHAIGAGGTWLSGGSDAVITSIGTGTALVLSKEGAYSHLGGTGVGGGTLCALGAKILDVADPLVLAEMAAHGTIGNIDLCIGDLFSGTATLDPSLTASNLAKANPSTANSDWAIGIFNLVLEVIGSMTVLACKAAGANKAVATGALATLPLAAGIFTRFEYFYGIPFAVADHADCATAIGAARLASC